MKKLLLIWPMVFALQSNPQTLNCRLKPPEFTLDFGSGSITEINTAALSNYERVSGSCPTDGHYSYVSSTTNCFRGDWHSLPQDHTGNGGGNMLLVNASYNGGTFLSTEIKGLKQNATYEFGVWMMNVCRITDKCPFPLLPDIVIRLQTSSGKTVAMFGTGDLQRRPSPHWTQYRAKFTMPSSDNSLQLIMTDNTPGGCGNDFAVDDITIRECVPYQPAVNPRLKAAQSKSKPPPAKKQPGKTTPVTTRINQKKDTTARLKKETSSSTVTLAKRGPVSFPAPPPMLAQRTNTTIKQIETEAGDIRLDLYDNGEIDGDTVSIYHNNSLVVANARLSQKPITLHIMVDASNPHHELVMVAENLGAIPPNTSLMIVTTGSKRYQVFISSTEQKNGRVVLDLKE